MEISLVRKNLAGKTTSNNGNKYSNKTMRRYWLSDFEGWICWAPVAERAAWTFFELKLILVLKSQSGDSNEGNGHQRLQGKKYSLCAICKWTSLQMRPLLTGEGPKQQHSYVCPCSAFAPKQLWKHHLNQGHLLCRPPWNPFLANTVLVSQNCGLTAKA